MKKQFNDSQAEKNELHTQIKHVERKLTVAVDQFQKSVRFWKCMKNSVF